LRLKATREADRIIEQITRLQDIFKKSLLFQEEWQMMEIAELFEGGSAKCGVFMMVIYGEFVVNCLVNMVVKLHRSGLLNKA
jgi:hypothetical protein